MFIYFLLLHETLQYLHNSQVHISEKLWVTCKQCIASTWPINKSLQKITPRFHFISNTLNISMICSTWYASTFQYTSVYQANKKHKWTKHNIYARNIIIVIKIQKYQAILNCVLSGPPLCLNIAHLEENTYSYVLVIYTCVCIMTMTML